MGFIRVLHPNGEEYLLNSQLIEHVMRHSVDSTQDEIYSFKIGSEYFLGKILGGSGAVIKNILKVMKHMNSRRNNDTEGVN